MKQYTCTYTNDPESNAAIQRHVNDMSNVSANRKHDTSTAFVGPDKQSLGTCDSRILSPSRYAASLRPLCFSQLSVRRFGGKEKHSNKHLDKARTSPPHQAQILHKPSPCCGFQQLGASLTAATLGRFWALSTRRIGGLHHQRGSSPG